MFPLDAFQFSFGLLSSASVFLLSFSAGPEEYKFQHSSKPYRLQAMPSGHAAKIAGIKTTAYSVTFHLSINRCPSDNVMISFPASLAISTTWPI